MLWWAPQHSWRDHVSAPNLGGDHDISAYPIRLVAAGRAVPSPAVRPLRAQPDPPTPRLSCPTTAALVLPQALPRHPDIAVYLTHGREQRYITRFFDDLTYQPDAISQDDLDVYARAFEAPGVLRALRELPPIRPRCRQPPRRDRGPRRLPVPVPVLASGDGAQTLTANYAPMCEEIATDVTGPWCPTPAIGSPRRTLTISVACSSNSTPHPEPNSRVGRTIDTPKALLRDALKVTPAVKRVRGRTAPCERRTRLVMGELKTAHSCTGSSLSASGLASATGTCTSYGHSGAS